MTVTLRPLIQQVLAESSSTDADDLAREVLARIPGSDRETALFQALRSMVYETFRPSFSPPKLPAGPAAARPQRSAKVAAIRDAWERALLQRIATGSGLKRLRDCTIPDLEHAATQREALARQVAARAADLRRLIEVMRHHDAATLGDVPAAAVTDLRDTLSRVAA